MLAIAAGLVVLALFVWAVGFGLGGSSDAPSGLSGETRVGFVRSATETCIQARRANAGDAAQGDGTIAGYCGCYAERLAGDMTQADVDRLSKAGPEEVRAAMQSRMDKASESCADALDDAPTVKP